MDTPVLTGQKRSRFNFMKLDIYADRLFAKNEFFMKKIIPLNEIISWTEINRKISAGNITFTELTVYTEKTKHMINSLHWANYLEIKELLTNGKTRDTAKEEKIYKSFW